MIHNSYECTMALVCMRMCVRACVLACVLACMHVGMWACMYVHLCVCLSVCLSVCPCITFILGEGLDVFAGEANAQLSLGHCGTSGSTTSLHDASVLLQVTSPAPGGFACTRLNQVPEWCTGILLYYSLYYSH